MPTASRTVKLPLANSLPESDSNAAISVPEKEDISPLPNLIGLSKQELAARFISLGVPEKAARMRVSQFWNAVYARGARSFEDITTFSKDLRAQLGQHFTLDRPQISQELISKDGTRKWLLRLNPAETDKGAGPEIETVYIPEQTRGTLCISSQVGCTLNCSFCHTGTMKLVRNLTAEEIVGQIMLARDRIGDWPDAEADNKAGLPNAERKITNIVLMGMGEPLYNFDNVREAVLIALDSAGLGYSKRRITLSTSGVVPQIARAGQEMGIMLAISLHATRDELRNELVPINKKYPLKELLEACRNYPDLSNARRITFEYVMLKGKNDTLADARRLVNLLKGIPAKINLIPFNPWPGSAYECSSWADIEKFADYINKAGYASPVRTPRGRDIMAACGQLKSASQKRRASERRLQQEIKQKTDS